MTPEDKHSPHHPSRLVLSQEKIEESSIKTIELVEVEYGEEVWGPIWRNHLKVHLDMFSELSSQLRVRDVNTEMAWLEINQHPFFQKRHTDPLPHVNKDQVGDLFYLIQAGQKIGPFTKEQINDRIENLKLKMTDTISLDMGRTWVKVYQISEFDQRLKEKSTQDEEGVQSVEALYEQLRKTNVTGLKVLKNLSQQDSTNPSYDISNTTVASNYRAPKPKKEKKEKPPKRDFDYSQFKWFALFVVAFVGILGILRMWNTPESDRRPASVEAKKGSIQEAKKKRKEKIKIKEDQKKKQAKTVINKRPDPKSARRPASIRKNRARAQRSTNNIRMNRSRTRRRARANRPITNSRAFKSTQRENNRAPASEDYNDDNYYDDKDDYKEEYDDGTVTDENDPVRGQVSKETLDPDLDSDDSYEDEKEYSNDDYQDQNSEEEVFYSPIIKNKKSKAIKKTTIKK